MRVLVGATTFGEADHEAEDRLVSAGIQIVRHSEEHLSEVRLTRLLDGVDGVMAGLELYPSTLIQQHAGKLRIIARIGSGYDNVDIASAQQCGVIVTNTPEAPVQAVAELTVCSIICCLRGLVVANRHMLEGRWVRPLGLTLSDRLVGILGLGRIGKQVAKILHVIGCRLLACDLTPDKEFAERHEVVLVDAETLFRSADVVSVHIPLSSANRGFVNANLLYLMRQGSYLVNTARGGVVDEKSLIEVLLARRLAGAAIDVFEGEPYAGPLLDIENVVVTPHMGARTCETRSRMEKDAAEDVLRVLRGLPPLRPVVPPL